MRDHHVRHLPVLDGGRIVGIVSERDLLLLEAANRAVFSPRRFVTQLLRGSDVAATAHFDERVGIERAPSSYEELS
jgi:CBS domain-containing protein